jgi:hypothetical protein
MDHINYERGFNKFFYEFLIEKGYLEPGPVKVEYSNNFKYPSPFIKVYEPLPKLLPE